MPTAALELKYLKLITLTHDVETILVMRAKYQVVRMPTGVTCGVKTITRINNYSNRKLTGFNRSLRPKEAPSNKSRRASESEKIKAAHSIRTNTVYSHKYILPLLQENMIYGTNRELESVFSKLLRVIKYTVNNGPIREWASNLCKFMLYCVDFIAQSRQFC